MNKVLLIGNVGKEPAVRYIDPGVCVASVSLATTERGYSLPNGTQVPERTEWHNLIFWRKQAEVVEKYVHKGDKLFVEGKIQTRTYMDKQGTQRRSIDIIVENMEMLSTRSQTVQTPLSGSEVQNANSATDRVQVEDEKLPF